MKKAFTLAEIIVVIGIIGIIAEMSIPTIINNIQEQIQRIAYKKAYSIASQVAIECANDNSFVPRTTWTDEENNTINWNVFKDKFQLIKYCDGTTTNLSNCWNFNGEKFNASTAPVEGLPGFIDKSGMSWVQDSSSNGKVITGDVFVDTNGFKRPNKFGKDRFRLWFEANANGLPVKVRPDPDYLEYDYTYCKYPPCYYKSWLLD